VTAITYGASTRGATCVVMSPKRVRQLLIASGLMALVAVAGMELYVVRDLVAALFVLCALFGAIGIFVLVSFLLGEGAVRCFALLATSAASFRHRQLAEASLPHGIRKS